MTKPVLSTNQRTPFLYGITNPSWLNLKILYFLEYGALGALIPYIILFYKKRGLTVSQIGIIETVFFFIGSISRPLFGSIADRTARHKIVLGICILVFTIVFSALNFIQISNEPVVRYPLHLTCNTSTHEFQLEACRSAEGILVKVSSIQPELVLHHVDAGFQNNCSSIRNTCQVVCRGFKSIKTQLHFGISEDPFRSLALHVGENRSSSFIGQCSAFPLTVTSSNVLIACNNTQSMPCDIDCGCSLNRTNIDPISYNKDSEKERKNADSWRIFVTALLLRGVGAIPFGPSISLADSITYDILGPRYRNLWGQQRMWGTLSWGVIAGVLGLLVDVYDTFNPIFYAFGAYGIAAALVALLWLPKRVPIHNNEQPKIINPIITKQPHKPAAFGAALSSIFRIPMFCIACFITLVSGMFLGVLYVVWPILIIHDLHGSQSLIGLAALISCGLEVPSLFFAGAVVNRLGEAICFLLMLAAFTVRFVCYAYLTPATVWLSLLLEVLHIFCFAFFWTAATRLAATIAPPGTSATVQAVLQALYFGIGLGLGNLLSSFIYHKFGSHVAFLIYAAFAALVFFILLILYFAYIRKAVARAKSRKPERMGSFSPALNPDASYMDEDDDPNQIPLDTSSSSDGSKKKKNKDPDMGDPLITSSAPHFADL